MTILVVALSALVFQMIFGVHESFIKYHQLKVVGLWDIPFQTMETLIEFRMIRFYGTNIASARLFRGFYIFFCALIVMAYSSTLRSALVSREMDEPIDSPEVCISFLNI